MPAADRKNSDLRAEIVKDKFRSDTPPARATILSFLQPEKSDAFADALSEPRYTRLGHGTPVCYLLIFMPKKSIEKNNTNAEFTEFVLFSLGWGGEI